MKKTITIDDTLDGRVKDAQNEIKQLLEDALVKAHDGNADALDNLTLESIEDDARDSLMEIADSNTPIYTSEIDDIFYLHRSDVEGALDDAGLGDDAKNDKNSPCGDWRAGAICMYIESKLQEYLAEYIEEEKSKE